LFCAFLALRLTTMSLDTRSRVFAVGHLQLDLRNRWYCYKTTCQSIRDQIIHLRNVNICRYGSKKCTLKSEAVQCNFWLRASCEGLSNDQYKLLTQLTSSVNNDMYYCNFNKCETHSKQLMFGSISRALFTPADCSETSIPVQQDCLSKQLNDLSEKIADLAIKQTLHDSMQCNLLNLLQTRICS